MAKKVSEKAIRQFNDLAGFMSFVPTWDFKQFIRLPHKTIAHFTGNQRGKNAQVAYSYVLRILGRHPVPKKNVVYLECEQRAKLKAKEITLEDFLESHKSKDSCTFTVSGVPKDGKCPECGGSIVQHKRSSRVFRFCSENLPGQSANTSSDGASAEVKNTQYPEFKKWLPKFLIKKDITARNPAMIIRDPFNGPDIITEFVSYNQSVQSTAGTQKMSIWSDEESDKDFDEEQKPRLLAEDGDIVYSLTPANRITWMYDDVFEKAQIYIRTKVICDFLSNDEYKAEQIEVTENKSDIAVIMAATDDNPTLDPEVIDAIFDDIDDPDVLAIRRYGIFKQVSGRIFKSFEYSTHVIDKDRYFPDGMFHNWVHARAIDYHEHNPWAIGFMSLSPTNEAFIWWDWTPSPEKLVTMEIAQHVAGKSGDYRFSLSLIDPLATKTQSNTGTSVVDDLNRLFHEYRHEGTCTGGYWEPWDTKSTRGRDEIRMRLKNSKRVGLPFNNVIKNDGMTECLPTLWILNNCKQSAKFMKQWRIEEYADSKSLVTKDAKDKPQQKYSHLNMVWEAIFKDLRFRPRKNSYNHTEKRDRSRYMQGRR